MTVVTKGGGVEMLIKWERKFRRMLKRFLGYGLMSQDRWDCHFWEVTDGEDMELTGAGWFDEVFQMWIFARYEVNERGPHQLAIEGSWKWAEDADKAAKG